MVVKKEPIEFLGGFLIKVVLLTLFGTIIFQGIIYYQPYNLKISLLSNLEGEQIIYQDAYPTGDLALGVKTVTFKVESPYITSLPDAKIFCNNKLVGDFSSLQVTVIVELGDIITIDNSKYLLNLLIKTIPSEGINIKNEIIINKKEKVMIVIGRE